LKFSQVGFGQNLA